MSSGGVFSETLQSITSTKLVELSKRRSKFEVGKSNTQSTLIREPNQRKRLRILLDGVHQGFGIKTSKKRALHNENTYDTRLEILINNLERFLAQAEYDPSISSKTLEKWEQSLVQQMDTQSSKYQYATLYGELVTEWLTSERAAPADDTTETAEGFQQVKKESAARTEAREGWENLVFEPFETDQVAISTYLNNLFGGSNGENKQALKALDALRKKVDKFETALSAPAQFNASVLQWTIKGLIDSGLLSEEKRAALKDFLTNPVILNEVADVLNMRTASLDTWEWDADLPVEQRRHLNGSYHMFIDEDLIQALFLQYIGVKWSVFFKRSFKSFARFEGAWSPLQKPISNVEKMRREYFLKKSLAESRRYSPEKSVLDKRKHLYKRIYFMTQLPDFETQDKAEVEGDEEVRFAPVSKLAAGSAVRHRKISAKSATAADFADFSGIQDDDDSDDDNDGVEIPKTKMETKQFLLHLLSTELLLNTRLHSDFTCTRSEFADWNTSLPHSTLFSVLEFFGFSPKWMRFFRKFVEAPLRFSDDDPTTESRIRKRGVPDAHALSTVCSEIILFCLDYAVNQKTEGAIQLHRIQEDFWLWSKEHEMVVKGWEAVVSFSETMGVALDKNKTGSIRITQETLHSGTPAPLNPLLPIGEIRWGFLRLDPCTGRFIIDQTLVEQHVQELQTQLRSKTRSVFAWIQAWNTYSGRFFRSNFAPPANCFGRQHVDAMLASFQQIQRQIFVDTNVVAYLRKELKERFGISDVPDGYFYFPTSLGGLQLHNPFIGLLQLRDSILEDPSRAVDDFLNEELENYERAKMDWLEDRSKPGVGYGPNRPPDEVDSPTEFMAFEEFTRYREDFPCCFEKGDMNKLFGELLKKPEAETAELNTGDVDMLSGVEIEGMDERYWKWVVKLYGEEMRERFGGFSVVDKGLLPIGMVNLFRSGRVKWQG